LRFQRTRNITFLAIAVIILLSLLSIISTAIWYWAEQQKPPPPPIEIVDLKIGGIEKKAEVKNSSHTSITFTLKHNDGKSHRISVIFKLEGESIRHASIVTEPGYPLTRSNTQFFYDKTIDATDAALPQKVLAWAHMKAGLTSVVVKMKVSLAIDGQLMPVEHSLELEIKA